ncbi:MAG: C_GCAxxG_C_C family protein [Oscillospiraceae bacterium]|nr:C_GCAxxG_C_C family protein [Oscillospiraceae bacterium]
MNALCPDLGTRAYFYETEWIKMSIQEEAVRLHSDGCNCAQCVLCACSKYTGLEKEISLAIACGFGGGVRCGEICGAISGAVMAIGAAAKQNMNGGGMANVASLTKKTTGAFREKFGSVRCLDLKRAGVPCDELIAFGAETAEKLIKEERGE